MGKNNLLSPAWSGKGVKLQTGGKSINEPTTSLSKYKKIDHLTINIQKNGCSCTRSAWTCLHHPQTPAVFGVPEQSGTPACVAAHLCKPSFLFALYMMASFRLTINPRAVKILWLQSNQSLEFPKKDSASSHVLSTPQSLSKPPPPPSPITIPTPTHAWKH